MTIKVTYNVTDVYMTQSVSPVYINVSYPTTSTGGGTWGTITGTLSNQTDLQTALNLKVPYSGATANVDLGEYELKAGQVTLDTTPTGTAAVGTTRWNDTTGTSETTLKGGSVILKNGVDLVARVVNKVTPNTTLTKAAYQAVRVSGAQGQRLAVALAQANNDANSADTIGLVTETIATNQEGFIMTVGQLEGINTTGSLQGETWVDGDVLYLSPTTAGAITNVQPTGSGHIVVIGYVEYAHVNNGKIYVKVLNGWELTELHDTEIISPANNEALIYESSSALWKNKTIATALGYTPANAATTLTINGVTYDLSTSRTWTIAAGISGSGASGQVTYWTGASAVSGSNNLFWDNTNSRLGIGTNVPARTLSVNGSIGIGANSLIQESGALNLVINQTAFYNLELRTNNATRLTVFAGGNIGINSSDLGVRLGVVGDTLLRGSGATSATTALTVQNSSSTNLLVVRNDGNVGIGTNAPAVNLDIISTANAYLRVQRGNNGTNDAAFVTQPQGTLSASNVSWNYGLQAGSNNFRFWYYNGSTTATSLNITNTGNVHIGSGTDATSRLQVTGDTLLRGSGATSATTALTVQNSSSTNLFRVRNNGTINMSLLPTSATGLVAGDLWNDAGTVKIV